MLKTDICLTQKDLPHGWSPHLIDLINRLLIKNANERLGFNGVRELK